MTEIITIEIPDESSSVDCGVEKISDSLYKLVEQPLLTESFKYGDIIIVEKASGNQFRFVEVAIELADKTFVYVLTEEKVKNPNLEGLLKRFSEDDIYWQKDFGGCFYFSQPLDSSIDIQKELDEL